MCGVTTQSVPPLLFGRMSQKIPEIGLNLQKSNVLLITSAAKGLPHSLFPLNWFTMFQISEETNILAENILPSLEKSKDGFSWWFFQFTLSGKSIFLHLIDLIWYYWFNATRISNLDLVIVWILQLLLRTGKYMNETMLIWTHCEWIYQHQKPSFSFLICAKPSWWTTPSLTVTFRHVQTQHCVWPDGSFTTINDLHSNGVFSSFSVPLTCQHSTVSISIHIRAGTLPTSSPISPVNLAILDLSVFIFNFEQKYLFGLRDTIKPADLKWLMEARFKYGLDQWSRICNLMLL